MSKSAHITDQNGYSAKILETVSEWTGQSATQASQLCSATELSSVDESKTAVYARVYRISAEFEETEQGDWSDGGAGLMAEFHTSRPNGSAAGTFTQVTCRSNNIRSDDAYGYKDNNRYLFDVSPSQPTSSMDVFLLVPKTPKNPDGAFPDGAPVGHILLGAHADPAQIPDGMITGRADDFEKYLKFGFLGDDVDGEQWPDGGTIEPGSQKLGPE